MVWFSIVEIVFAGYWALYGWEPWNMPLDQAARGRRLLRAEYSPIQIVTVAFFRTPRCRRLAFGCAASGASLPWIIGGVTTALGATTLRLDYAMIPAWGMAILGFMDSVRGRSIVYRIFAREFLANWDEIRAAAAELGGSTPEIDEKSMSFQPAKDVFKGRGIVWLILAFAALCLLAYLRGRARRGL
jgi:hypothetical protein